MHREPDVAMQAVDLLTDFDARLPLDLLDDVCVQVVLIPARPRPKLEGFDIQNDFSVESTLRR